MYRSTSCLRACAALAILCGATARGDEAARAAIALQPGPHLLVDEFLVAASEGVQRQVLPLQRERAEPVVTSGPEHRNWQPWFTVLRDPALRESRRFRMWYNADADANDDDDRHQTQLGYLESADGIHWPGIYQPLEHIDSLLFGASVVDDGAQSAVAAERYKLVYSRAPRGSNSGRNEEQGIAAAFSPDGLHWTMYNEGKTLVPLPSRGSDSWNAAWDPLRGRYLLVGKKSEAHAWTNAEGQHLDTRIRVYGTSLSPDFKSWSPFSEPLFWPDEKDPGITEWYGITGFQTRGDLIIGFLQLLRDDLSPEGVPAEAKEANRGHAGSGMGWTVLCWSRDGETWQRDHQSDALLSPNPTVGAWDHAIAWVGSTVAVGDELYLYYSGYRWGHKYRRSLDRQIGLVKMKRDRFVARHAGPEGGTLTTPLVSLRGAALTLNIDAAAGEARVEVLDAAGQPIPGLTLADCRPITGDALAAPVVWASKSLADVAGQPVRLRFALRNASLFALEVAPSWIFGSPYAGIDGKGYSIAGRAVFYLSGEAFRGFWLKAHVGYEHYDATLTNPADASDVSAPRTLGSAILGVLFGDTWVIPRDGGFALSGGIGVAFATASKVTLTTNGTVNAPPAQASLYDGFDKVRLLGSVGLGVAF